jgi:anti-sigma regulatory factor (Ser/Thr protein kinase)
LPLGPLDTAPGTARATVRATLGLWGLSNLGELAADTELLTSELVTNAIAASQRKGRHDGKEPVQVILGLTSRPGALCVSVWDPDPELPPLVPELPPLVPELPGEWSETGRGLGIVAIVASRWGASPGTAQQGGKYVWAELPVPRTS